MKSRLLLGLVLLAWLSFHSAANAQTKSSGPSIDDLIDWSDPLALTQQKLISFLDAHSKDRRKPSYTIVTDESESRVTFHPGNSAQGSMLEDTMFGGLFEVTHVAVSCYRTSSSFDITLNNRNVTKKKLAALEILLAQKTGDSHPKRSRLGRRVKRRCGG